MWKICISNGIYFTFEIEFSATQFASFDIVIIIFRNNYINITATDATVVIIQDMHVVCFHDKWFQLPTPSQCSDVMVNTKLMEINTTPKTINFHFIVSSSSWMEKIKYIMTMWFIIPKYWSVCLQCNVTWLTDYHMNYWSTDILYFLLTDPLQVSQLMTLLYIFRKIAMKLLWQYWSSFS